MPATSQASHPATTEEVVAALRAENEAQRRLIQQLREDLAAGRAAVAAQEAAHEKDMRSTREIYEGLLAVDDGNAPAALPDDDVTSNSSGSVSSSGDGEANSSSSSSEDVECAEEDDSSSEGEGADDEADEEEEETESTASTHLVNGTTPPASKSASNLADRTTHPAYVSLSPSAEVKLPAVRASAGEERKCSNTGNGSQDPRQVPAATTRGIAGDARASSDSVKLRASQDQVMSRVPQRPIPDNGDRSTVPVAARRSIDGSVPLLPLKRVVSASSAISLPFDPSEDGTDGVRRSPEATGAPSLRASGSGVVASKAASSESFLPMAAVTKTAAMGSGKNPRSTR